MFLACSYSKRCFKMEKFLDSINCRISHDITFFNYNYNGTHGCNFIDDIHTNCRLQGSNSNRSSSI